MDGEPAEHHEYRNLAVLADALLGECDEDVVLLAERLDGIAAPVRGDLLESDFLNAFQVFYYFFRTMPGDIETERLILVPASELQYGILIDEIELIDLIFAVIDKEPVMLVSDGDQELVRFTGTTAYRDGLDYAKSML